MVACSKVAPTRWFSKSVNNKVVANWSCPYTSKEREDKLVYKRSREKANPVYVYLSTVRFYSFWFFSRFFTKFVLKSESQSSKNMNVEFDPIRILQFESFCSCVGQECSCGEKSTVRVQGFYSNVQAYLDHLQTHEWEWDEDLAGSSLVLSEGNHAVRFHPGFSTGTVAIRANKSMAHGRHHYWEVKMLTPVYGTDVMIGVGTDKVDLNVMRLKYCSLLGRDSESWGFSYRGYIQHAGESRSYSACFGQGSLVGVHLDTWKGTLQFFLNRKPLGMAFTGLKGLELYPMISSTAAESKCRITRSCSIEASLQIECLSLLRPFQKAYISTAFPGLRYLSQSIFADVLQKRSVDEEDDEDVYECPDALSILDDFDLAIIGFGRRKRRKRLDDEPYKI